MLDIFVQWLSWGQELKGHAINLRGGRMINGVGKEKNQGSATIDFVLPLLLFAFLCEILDNVSLGK